MIKKDYDCAIIGMGPGGITAAIYLKRFITTKFNDSKKIVLLVKSLN